MLLTVTHHLPKVSNAADKEAIFYVARGKLLLAEYLMD